MRCMRTSFCPDRNTAPYKHYYVAICAVESSTHAASSLAGLPPSSCKIGWAGPEACEYLRRGWRFIQCCDAAAACSCRRGGLFKVSDHRLPIVEDGNGDAEDEEVLDELLVVGPLGPVEKVGNCRLHTHPALFLGRARVLFSACCSLAYRLFQERQVKKSLIH